MDNLIIQSQQECKKLLDTYQDVLKENRRIKECITGECTREERLETEGSALIERFAQADIDTQKTRAESGVKEKHLGYLKAQLQKMNEGFDVVEMRMCMLGASRASRNPLLPTTFFSESQKVDQARREIIALRTQLEDRKEKRERIMASHARTKKAGESNADLSQQIRNKDAELNKLREEEQICDIELAWMLDEHKEGLERKRQDLEIMSSELSYFGQFFTEIEDEEVSLQQRLQQAEHEIRSLRILLFR